MSAHAKILVLGPPDGDQGRFVGMLSRVKIRSSASTRTGDGVLPMSFGRVPLEPDLDLQLYSADRENAGQVAQALAAGLVGAVLTIDRKDLSDPHYLHVALDELHSAGITTVVVTTAANADLEEVRASLDLPSTTQVLACPQIDHDGVKQVLIALLETVCTELESVA